MAPAAQPFLLLSIRSVEAAAAEEYTAFQRGLGLTRQQLHRIRLDREWPSIQLADYSGIILGGGPYNMSDPEEIKSAAQRRAEAWILRLLDEVVATDFPFLGACYGIGTLGRHQGYDVGRDYPEPAGPLTVDLTPAGQADPLFAGLPATFFAYGGHKEGLNSARLGPNGVLLATSAAAPVQAFRVGENVYATQFHPELDYPGMCTRLEVYQDVGYFPAEELESLKQLCATVPVELVVRILHNFATRYQR